MDIELSNLDQAITMITKIINEVGPEGYNNLLGKAYVSLGDAFYKKKELIPSIEAYLEASRIIENQRQKLPVEELKIGYFSNVQRVYRRLAECYFLEYQKNPKIAFIDSLYYYSELSRSRAMKDLVFHDSHTAIDQNSKTFTEYQEIVNRLCALQRNLRMNRPKNSDDPRLAEHEVLRYSLIGQRMRLVENVSNSQNQNPNRLAFLELFETLKHRNLGLLLYHISEQTSFVLAVSNGKYEVIRLPVNSNTIAKSIDSLVLPFHNLIAEEIDHSIFRAEIAHSLYESLIKPVENRINLKQQILIIPDKELAKLPFEILLINSTSRRKYLPSDSVNYADDFLVNKYGFIYSPSSTLLLKEYPRPTTESRLLVLANPFDRETYSDSRAGGIRGGVPKLSPLPFSELEAHKIKTIYPSTQVYKRDQATKDHFLEFSSRKNNIIHIATHAFVDSIFDAFSGLILAAGDDSTDDGYLMGFEISKMNLQCDLISLSACETGIGKFVPGEGTMSLPRFLLRAGAKSVLMTHWRVDDRFTSIMMPEFYDQYINKKLSKAEALRQAKLHIIKSNPKIPNKYRHPFYWASFALYGVHSTNNYGATSDFSLYTVVILAVALLILSASYFYYKRK